jgi:putative acetyltransferase
MPLPSEVCFVPPSQEKHVTTSCHPRNRTISNSGTPRILAPRYEIRLHPGPAAGHRGPVLIRRETGRDANTIRAITTAAFAPGQPPGQIPNEARLIDELRASPAWLPALSLVAVTPAGEIIGHVLCTRGHVGQDPVLALGPLAVRPDHQRRGVGSALMHAILGAADALGEPLVALLGDPAYYRRFGFELSTAYQIIPPEPHWQPHFQVRVLTGYQPRLHGTFTYPEPFDRT